MRRIPTRAEIKRRRRVTTSKTTIRCGDVLAVLRELPDNEFDGLLCDPPYGLSFMGKRWDYDVPSVDVWRECMRVLKPGAPLIAFFGTRTYHRGVVAIEDAGFEIRDCLSWMYGSGFPKSHDVSKAIDKAEGAEREIVGQAHRKATGRMAQGEGGYAFAEDYALTAPATAAARLWAGYGTALKPAWEPAVLARKPLEGTVAQNVAKWGVGGLAIDACRIGEAGGTTRSEQAPYAESGWRTGHKVVELEGLGRWPANVCLDEEAGAMLDAQSGTTGARARATGPTRTGRSESVARNAANDTNATAPFHADSGGASRFFYCAKVSTKEREHGCNALPHRSVEEIHGREEGSPGALNPRAGAQGRGGARNHHPTLKPIALTTWLARLILPPTPGATLLVPYSGAGSEIIGAMRAGWSAVFGIEGEQDYVEIAHARIDAWCSKLTTGARRKSDVRHPPR